MEQGTVFVGRELELDELSSRLNLVLSGQPAMVSVSGDAGVGKTRLLREFSDIARRLSLKVVVGRATEDSATPYLPFMGVLEACLKDASSSGLDALTRLKSFAADTQVGPRSASRHEDVGYDRLRLFVAIVREIVNFARCEPLLIVLDDLHWADPPSLELLGQLVFVSADARGNQRLPLMIAVAHRPVPPDHRLSKLLSRLSREAIVRAIELEGFGPRETHSLLRSLGLQRAANQLVDAVQRVTHGYPLFIREFLHQLDRKGLLETTGGYVTAKAPAAGIALPRDVSSALSERLEVLNQNELATLTLAAFTGDAFVLERMARIAGLSVDRLLNVVERGLESELLVHDGALFRFRHPLIRHVLAERASPTRQLRLHLQIAGALEQEPASGELSLEIAGHLLAAGPLCPPARLLHYTRQAAEHAFAIYAWAEAARMYASAAEAAAQVAESTPSLIGELHCLAGRAYQNDFDFGPCSAHFEKALAAYAAGGDLVGQAQALRFKTLLLYNNTSTSYGDALELHEQRAILARLGSDQPLVRGQLMEVMSQVYWVARRSPEAEEIARRALELGQRADDDRLRYRASFSLGLALFQSGRLHEARETFTDSLNYAVRARDDWGRVQPLQRLAILHLVMGQIEQAEELGNEGRTLTTQVGQNAEASIAYAHLATVALARGDYASVESLALEAVSLSQRAHYPWGGMIALTALARARALTGRLDDALHTIELLAKPGEIVDTPSPPLQFSVAVWRDYLTALCTRQASPSRLSFYAENLGKGPLDINSGSLMCAFLDLAAMAGTAEGTAPVRERLETLASNGLVLTSGGVFLVRRVLARAAAVAGETEQAESGFQQAIASAERLAVRPELARSLLDYAAWSRAREPAQRAAQLFAELGMPADQQRALQLAAGSGEVVRRALTITEQEALGPREIELLRGIARGRGYAEIAREWLVSPNSVAALAEQVFHKIEVSGPALATAYAFARGLIGAELSPIGGPSVLMVTDMVGFTSFVESVGDLHARTIIHAHNRIIRQQLTSHRGKEVTHTGDGIMAVFASGDDAIRCAIGIQIELGEYSRRHPETPIRVRVGLNAGHVLPEEDRLFGAALIAAVRICANATAGQILVSESTLEMTLERTRIQSNLLGSFPLKGFTAPVRLYELPWSAPVNP